MPRPLSDALVRRLALITWVSHNPGARLEETATHFDVDVTTIRDDVTLLWSAGRRDAGYEELVDFDAEALEEGRLKLREGHGLDRPLRLERHEALALSLALGVLTDLLGEDPTARPYREARTLLEELLTEDAPAPAPAPGDSHPQSPAAPSAMNSDVPQGEALGVLSRVQSALDTGVELEVDYVDATDRRSTRVVDPLRLVSDGSHLTLEAWCHEARAVRHFRLDRILGAQVRQERVRRRRSLRGSDGVLATLEVAPSGRWIAEQVPCEGVTEHADGSLSLTIRGRSEAWLISLILSAGRSVRAVEPPSLAEAVREAARRALELYGPDLATPQAEDSVGL